MRIAVGPDDDGAAGAQIVEIDPRRAARQAVDQHARLRALTGIMGDIAAIPHRGDDVGGLVSGRLLEPLRDRGRREDRREKTRRGSGDRNPAAPDNRQRRRRQRSRNTAAHSAPIKASRVRSSAARANRTIHSPRNSHSGKPHIALVPRPVTSAQREQSERRTERQQRDDAAIEGVGASARSGSCAARPEQRRGDQQ